MNSERAKQLSIEIMRHEREKQIRDHLAKGIRTLRDACDDAERSLKSVQVQESVMYIPKHIAWGVANASSSFESAQMWLNLYTEETILSLREEIKKLKGEA